ncbi:hypothetical protein X777_07335, partial [Ooceraea biroi]
VIAELSDTTEPIAATEQIACHIDRILVHECLSARMAFALVDGASPLKVFPSAYTRGVPGAPYSRRKRTRHAD